MAESFPNYDFICLYCGGREGKVPISRKVKLYNNNNESRESQLFYKLLLHMHIIWPKIHVWLEFDPNGFKVVGADHGHTDML